jgi:endonuclease YncB( thermonuclease family)
MRFLAALLLSLALPAAAATIEGRVVGVTDGDTITVLDHQNIQHRIRIASIDAPEIKQPYYFGTDATKRW